MEKNRCAAAGDNRAASGDRRTGSGKFRALPDDRGAVSGVMRPMPAPDDAALPAGLLSPLTHGIHGASALGRLSFGCRPSDSLPLYGVEGNGGGCFMSLCAVTFCCSMRDI